MQGSLRCLIAMGLAGCNGTINLTDAPASSANLGRSILAAPAVSASSLMPVVNTSLIPTGSPGYSNERVQATSEAASIPTDGVGAFRIVCDFSHMAFDDPIVYPGQPGRAHLHSFFGNTALNANTTASSITTTGNSTCRGGIINRSGYWVASIIDTRTGRPVKPDSAIVYYKVADWAGGSKAGQVQPMPAGLRMIAGNAANTQSFANWWDSPHIWGCLRAAVN